VDLVARAVPVQRLVRDVELQHRHDDGGHDDSLARDDGAALDACDDVDAGSVDDDAAAARDDGARDDDGSAASDRAEPLATASLPLS